MASVVWLKRDLRLADHKPLAEAARSGKPVVVLYCYQPSLLKATDFGRCHLDFINESLQELDQGLQKLGGRLVVRHGEVVDVLQQLAAELQAAGIAGGIDQLWSHEETGTPQVTAINAAVAAWAQQHGVTWTECLQTGVVRNLQSRDGWAKRWTQLMEQPMAQPPARLRCVPGISPGRLMGAEELGVQGDPKPGAMKGGESRAQALLDSFLGGRAAGYSTNMSSPNTAWDGCSRLSAYLAWGCISLRNVYQRTKEVADTLRAAKAGSSKGSSKGGSKGDSGSGSKKRKVGKKAAMAEEEEEVEVVDLVDSDAADEVEVIDLVEGDGEDAGVHGGANKAAAAAAAGEDGGAVGLKDLAAFTARLRWRSHFMQKLEDEQGLVDHNMCRAYDGARDEQAPNPALLQAWSQGKTGYPMVDAVMRCFLETGWCNFRMRAMVFSFAHYHLWLHWKFTAAFLAPHFLDYEPGIHWPQAQMQAGTTGINTFRVYSPTKQVQDHDKEGTFIRQYVPELAAVPKKYIAEPWKMPASVQRECGCVIGRDYPAPVVPPEAGRQNCRQLYAVKASLKAKEEAAQVYKKHGSRKRPNPSTSSRRRGGTQQQQ